MIVSQPPSSLAAQNQIDAGRTDRRACCDGRRRWIPFPDGRKD